MIKSDTMLAWAVGSRKLTFVERCYVGFVLWREGVKRFPWPEPQTCVDLSSDRKPL